MSGIRTNAAAVMLGVSPNTLRSWERRFGYPSPARTSGGHRQYDLADVEALKQAFEETQNVSSAIAIARQRGAGPPSSNRLALALARFEEEKGSRLLEESLAIRSLERTVQEVLLPAVAELQREEPGSPEHGFAWRFASDWISALRRVAPPATRSEGVLLFDATMPGDLAALQVQALELLLRRAGLRTLTLTAATEPARLGRALRALQPDALVLGGTRASLDAIGRLVFAVRSAREGIDVLAFGGALPDTGASTVQRLGDAPLAARDALLERIAAAPAPAVRAPLALPDGEIVVARRHTAALPF